MTLIMGANLLKGCFNKFNNVGFHDKDYICLTLLEIKFLMERWEFFFFLAGLKRSELNLMVILGVVAVRNICLPLLGIGVVQAAHHLGMVTSDALYRFVLMFQYAVPPAINVGKITTYYNLRIHI